MHFEFRERGRNDRNKVEYEITVDGARFAAGVLRVRRGMYGKFSKRVCSPSRDLALWLAKITHIPAEDWLDTAMPLKSWRFLLSATAEKNDTLFYTAMPLAGWRERAL